MERLRWGVNKQRVELVDGDQLVIGVHLDQRITRDSSVPRIEGCEVENRNITYTAVGNARGDVCYLRAESRIENLNGSSAQ